MKIISLLLAGMLTVAALTAGGRISAADGETEPAADLLVDTTVSVQEQTEGSLRYVLSESGATVTGCTDPAAGSLVIPGTLGGAAVTAIAAGAFSGCAALAEVTVPESVTFIGYQAFAGTPWLSDNTDEFLIVGGGVLLKYSGTATQVAIPEGVVCIAEAFAGSAITDVTFPKTLVVIGDHAFDGCKKLASDLLLFEGLLSIGDYAFNRCQKLHMVLFPNSLETVGAYAFYYCPKMEGCKMPLRLKSVGEYAFYYCSSVRALTLPNCCTSIGEYSFANMGSVMVLNLSDGLTEIPAHAFQNIYFTGYLTLPSHVTTIGDYAFGDLHSLRTLRLPGTLVTIGEHAFEKCGMAAVNLPASVQTVGAYAFATCDDLTELTAPADSALTTVGEFAFSYADLMTTLVLPASLTSLGEQSLAAGCRVLCRGTEAAFNAAAGEHPWTAGLDLTFGYAD